MLEGVPLFVPGYLSRVPVERRPPQPESRCADMRPDSNRLMALVSHRPAKAIAMFLPSLEHPEQPTGAFEVGRCPKENDHVTSERASRRLVPSAIEPAVIVIEEFAVRERAKEKFGFLAGWSPVANDHRFMIHARRVLVVRLQESHGLLEETAVAVVGVNINYSYSHGPPRSSNHWS
jgi:hypothetical protein